MADHETRERAVERIAKEMLGLMHSDTSELVRVFRRGLERGLGMAWDAALAYATSPLPCGHVRANLEPVGDPYGGEQCEVCRALAVSRPPVSEAQVEELARELYAKWTTDMNMPYVTEPAFEVEPWRAISEHMRQSWRYVARYLLSRFGPPPSALDKLEAGKSDRGEALRLAKLIEDYHHDYCEHSDNPCECGWCKLKAEAL